jgi:membrane protease YdiL (CAAX protease family)
VLLYVWKRSLWPCMLVHGLNNALSYFVLPLVFAE